MQNWYDLDVEDQNSLYAITQEEDVQQIDVSKAERMIDRN